MEDQRCSLPHLDEVMGLGPEGQEDFFSLIQRVQSRRMDEQRASMMLSQGEEDQNPEPTSSSHQRHHHHWWRWINLLGVSFLSLSLHSETRLLFRFPSVSHWWCHRLAEGNSCGQLQNHWSQDWECNMTCVVLVDFLLEQEPKYPAAGAVWQELPCSPSSHLSTDR